MRLELRLVQLGVKPAGDQKFLVPAALNNATLLDDRTDRGKTAGRGKPGVPASEMSL